MGIDMVIFSGVYTTYGWSAEFAGKSIEKLKKKKEKSEEVFQKQVEAFFFHLSPVETSFKVENFTGFISNLQDCGIFLGSRGKKLSDQIYEKACTEKNEPVVRSLIERGICPPWKIIEPAIKANLKGLYHLIFKNYSSLFSNESKFSLFLSLSEAQELSDEDREVMIQFFDDFKNSISDQRKGKTLISAIFKLDENMLLRLLNSGLKAMIQSEGKTLLDLALEKGFIKLVDRLRKDPVHGNFFLEKTYLSLYVDPEQNIGAPPVSIANIPDDFFYRAIGNCKKGEERNREKLLLQIIDEILAKATPDQKGKLLNFKAHNNYTPLMEAIDNSLREVALRLIREKDTDITCEESISETALTKAIDPGENIIFEALIERLKGIGEDEKLAVLERGICLEGDFETYHTALAHAYAYGKADFAQKLLEIGANDQAIDKEGRKCLLYALRGGLFELAKEKIEKKIWSIESVDHLYPRKSNDIGDDDNEDDEAFLIDPPALEFCREKEYGKENMWDRALFLLQQGINIGAKDKGGNTVLHLASGSLSPMAIALIEEILRNPSIKDVLNTKNGENKTPFDLACESHNQIALKLLLEAGAEITWENALDWSHEVSDEILRFILSKENNREYVKSPLLLLCAKWGKWDLLTQLLAQGFPISLELKGFIALDYMKAAPSDLKNLAWRKFFEEVKDCQNNFENKRDFSEFFNLGIGDMELRLEMNGEVFLYNISKNLIAARSPNLSKELEENKGSILSLKPKKKEDKYYFLKSFNSFLRFLHSKNGNDIKVDPDLFKPLAKIEAQFAPPDLKGILRQYSSTDPAFEHWGKKYFAAGEEGASMELEGPSQESRKEGPPKRQRPDDEGEEERRLKKEK